MKDQQLAARYKQQTVRSSKHTKKSYCHSIWILPDFTWDCIIGTDTISCGEKARENKSDAILLKIIFRYHKRRWCNKSTVKHGTLHHLRTSDGLPVMNKTKDLVRAFNLVNNHKILVVSKHTYKTTITPFGLLEFPFMAFGLRNVIPTIRGFIDEVTRDFQFLFEGQDYRLAINYIKYLSLVHTRYNSWPTQSTRMRALAFFRKNDTIVNIETIQIRS